MQAERLVYANQRDILSTDEENTELMKKKEYEQLERQLTAQEKKL